MNDLLDERAEALLGKSLLGQATTGELHELEALGRGSQRVRDALDLIERSRGGFRVSSVGEELDMTAADLPDSYRPRHLAEALEKWFRTGTRTGAAAAVLLTGLLAAGAVLLRPDLPIVIVGGGIGGAGLVVLVASVLAARRRRLDIGSEIEAGGDVWLGTVERVQRQERRYMSRSAKLVMVAAFSLTPALFVLSGLSAAPLDRIFAYLSWSTIATGIVILQRRRMLGGLARV